MVLIKRYIILSAVAALGLSKPGFANSTIDTLDVAGVALGMTQTQAAEVISQDPRLTPLGKLDIDAEFTRDDLPEPILLHNKARNVQQNTDLEEITTYFTGQPSAPKIWKVTRTTHYSVGKQPTVDSLNASITQKYGASPASSKMNGNQLTWVYDQQGKQITGKPGEDLIKKCVSTGLQDLSFTTHGVQNKFLKLVTFPDDRARTAVAPECAEYRFARVYLSQTDGLVNKLDVALVDLSLAIPALNETLKYIDEQIAGAKNKKLEGAQQIAPKL